MIEMEKEETNCSNCGKEINAIFIEKPLLISCDKLVCQLVVHIKLGHDWIRYISPDQINEAFKIIERMYNVSI